MRPAGDLGHLLPVHSLVELVEPGIAIGLQEAAEVGQLCARMTTQCCANRSGR